MHRGVSCPTEEDIERAVRKATAKLAKFEAQVALFNYFSKDSPMIEICTHPDLDRVMSTEWLDAMGNWIEQARVELVEGLSNWSIRFHVTHIGGVMTAHVLNKKETGIFLYQKDKRQHREWQIVLEPLQSVGSEGQF